MRESVLISDWSNESQAVSVYKVLYNSLSDLVFLVNILTVACFKSKAVLKVLSPSPTFQVQVKVSQNPNEGRKEASELNSCLILTLIDVNLLCQVTYKRKVFNGLFIDWANGVEDKERTKEDTETEYLCVGIGRPLCAA
jgi:hypothetical protein